MIVPEATAGAPDAANRADGDSSRDAAPSVEPESTGDSLAPSRPMVAALDPAAVAGAADNRAAHPRLDDGHAPPSGQVLVRAAEVAAIEPWARGLGPEGSRPTDDLTHAAGQPVVHADRGDPTSAPAIAVRRPDDPPEATSSVAPTEAGDSGDETSAGGELEAVGPIMVSQPVDVFDLVPRPAPLRDPSLTGLADTGSSNVDTRSHLADLLWAGSGSFEEEIIFVTTASAPAAVDDPSLLRAWDPGRTWKALGDAIEPLGNVELDWERFRRVGARDGPMAQLAPTTATPVWQVEQFLGLAPGRIESLDPLSRPTSGTAMRCLDTIRLEAGETISFDVFFDPPSDAAAGDPTHRVNDFALITISVGGRTTAIPFADSLAVGKEGATGWQTIRYTAGTAGDYTFGFAVLDDGDSGPSRLYVDSVRRTDRSGFAFTELAAARPDELGGQLQVVAPAPMAIPDVVDAWAHQPLAFDPLANDRDPDPFDAMRLVGVDTAGTWGAVRFSAGQPVSYVAGSRFANLAAGEVGIDSFRYVVDGGNGLTQTATVTVRVLGVNDAPVTSPDAAAAREDGGTVLIPVLANDDDIDSDDGADSLRVVAAASARGGEVTVTGLPGQGISYRAGSAFDDLGAGETALDTVLYVAADRHGATTTGTVTVTITGSNDQPVAVGDSVAVAANRDVAVDVLANDRDPDRSDRLVLMSVNGVALAPGGSMTLASGAIVSFADGRLHYDPAGRFDHLAAGQAATDSFRYAVSDGQGGVAEATVVVTLSGVNDAPRPAVDLAVIDEDSDGLVMPLADLLANDGDPDPGDALRIIAVDGPGARLDGTTVVYDPGGRFEHLGVGQTATERLTYTLIDRAGAEAQGEIVVTIEGRNDAPLAAADVGGTVEENQAVSLDLLANDRDPDQGDRLAVVAIDGQGLVLNGGPVTTASGARVTLLADGRVSYDASGAFTHLGFRQTAVDSFTYRIADRVGATAEATIHFTISGVNDRPVAVDDIAGAIGQDAGQPLEITPLANDHDPDAGDILEIVAIAGQPVTIGTPVVLPSGAQVTVLAGGRLAYRPDGAFDHLAAGETAVDTIPYTVRDQMNAQATAQVQVTVVGASDAPVAVADRYNIDEDHLLTFGAANGVLANDYDPDLADDRRLFVSKVNGTAASVGTGIVLASGAQLLLNADGSFSYDPREAFDGLGQFESPSDSFTYTVSDGAGGESTATVTIHLVGQNDPPLAADDRVATTADAGVRIHVLANDRDTENADLRVIGIDQAHQDVVRINADGTLTYDPAGRFPQLRAGETATDRFFYTIDDSLGGRATAEVTVTIHGSAAPAAGRPQLLESFEVADGMLVAGWGREPGNVAAASPVTLFSGAVQGFEQFRPTHFDRAVRLEAAGSSAAGASPIEQYLGLAGDALPADSDGTGAGAASAIKTIARFSTADLDATGRLQLVFDWNFLSAEQVAAGQPGANDYAVLTVSSAATGTTRVVTLTDARETGLGASGWRTSTFDLTAAFRNDILAGQALTIGFAVVNDQDGTRPSALLVDNVRFNASPGADAELLISEAGGTFHTYRLPPVAVADQSPALATDAGSALVIEPLTLLANDHASPGATSLRLAGVDATGAQGAVGFDGTHITYDPRGRFESLAAGETATDRFVYRMTDANGGIGSGTATVSLTGLNDAPQARFDVAGSREDGGTVGIDVLANDDDVDTDDSAATLRIIEARADSGARVWFDAGGGGRLYYDADSVAAYQALGAGETTSDRITYRIADRWYGQPGHAESTTTATGEVIVTIEGANDTPTAVADSAATSQDIPVLIDVLANDRDPDRNDRLQVSRINGQTLAFGNPVILASGAIVGLTADGRLRYDPNGSFDGLRSGQTATDTLTYTAADGHGGSSDATLAVIVAGLNDAPRVVADSITLDEDHAISFSAQALLANDSDPDLGDVLQITSIQGSGVLFDGTTATFDPGSRFQALGLGETAVERLVYSVRDQAGVTATGEVTLTIEGRNDQPLASDDVAVVREDRLVTIDPLANDSDPDLADRGHLVITGVDTTGTRGLVQINSDGTLSYDPAGRFDDLDAGQTAIDRFDYLVSDGHGGTDRGTVSITVQGRNNLEQSVESFEAPLTWGPSPVGDAERSNSLVQAVPSHQELEGPQQLWRPTDGAAMLRLEARGSTSAAMEDFLGLQSGTLARDFTDIDGSRPHAGSAIRLQFAVRQGDEVSFDWLFDARDRTVSPDDGYADNDFALVTIGDSAGVRVYELSDVRQVGDDGASGWRAASFTARETGTLTIGVASLNDRMTEIGDLAQTQNSVLLVDNLRLNRDFPESFQLVQADPDGFHILQHPA